MRSEEINGNISYNGDRLHQHYNRDETFVVNAYVEVPAAGYGGLTRR